MKIPVGGLALRIRLFDDAGRELRAAVEPPWPTDLRRFYGLDEAADPGIDTEREVTTVSAAIGALSERIKHRLETAAFAVRGLQELGWEITLDGDVIIATTIANPQHARELLDSHGLAGALTSVCDLDDEGWPRLHQRGEVLA